MILFKDATLQVVQQFKYSAPEDVAYYLLNACEQHSLRAEGIHLRIAGMIDEQSLYYLEIQKYFPDIVFDKPADNTFANVEMQSHPNIFLVT